MSATTPIGREKRPTAGSCLRGCSHRVFLWSFRIGGLEPTASFAGNARGGDDWRDIAHGMYTLVIYAPVRQRSGGDDGRDIAHGIYLYT